MIDSILKILQAIALGAVLLITGCLLVLPDIFGMRAQRIFQSLEIYDLGLELNAKGPTLSYTKSEAQEAFNDQTSLDVIVEKYECILSQECSDEEVAEISDLLGFGKTYQNTEGDEAGEWLVIFAASENIDDKVVERLILNRSGFEIMRILREGVYRFVVQYDTLAQAEEKLPFIKSISGRNDAYIRKFSNWCEKRQLVEKPKRHYFCSSN